MSEEYSMDDLIQRFAISALSKERKDEAVNEEILVGKYTGEFFIKSKDGVVISTDILNRFKASSDNAVRVAESIGMVGNLYHLEFDNMPMPCHIDYETNIIDQEPIQVENCKAILFNIDYDEFDIIGAEIKPLNSDGIVKIIIDVTDVNGIINEMVVEKSIQTINYSIIEFDEGSSINVKSIEIVKDEKVFNDDANDRTIILHNLFMTVNN